MHLLFSGGFSQFNASNKCTLSHWRPNPAPKSTHTCIHTSSRIWRRLSWETNSGVYEQLTDRILPRETLRPRDDIPLTDHFLFSCSNVFRSSGLHDGSGFKLISLWDVRIIQEARSKNKSERSHQSNTRPSRCLHVRSSLVALCGAFKQSLDLWAFLHT